MTESIRCPECRAQGADFYCHECRKLNALREKQFPRRESLTFRKELQALINTYSQENGCNTPDFILADYLCNCLVAFDNAVNYRAQWYGHKIGLRISKQPVDMDWKLDNASREIHEEGEDEQAKETVATRLRER